MWLVCAAEFLRGVSFSAIFAIYAFQSSRERDSTEAPQDPILYKNIAISTLVLRVPTASSSLFFDMPC